MADRFSDDDALQLLNADWASYIPSLAPSAPLVWLRFRETTGTTVVNYGTGGATFDGVWTPGSGAQGQADSLGANEAYNFQSGSLVTVPISGLLSTSHQMTMVFLCKPATAGPSGIGMFAIWGAQNTELRFNAALTSLIAFVDINGTDCQSTTTTGLTASQNAILAQTWDYDTDKLIRLYRGVNGVATEFGYSTQTPGGGGAFLNRSGNLQIGNTSGNTRIQNGLIGEFLFWPSILSASVLNKITTLSKAA